MSQVVSNAQLCVPRWILPETSGSSFKQIELLRMTLEVMARFGCAPEEQAVWTIPPESKDAIRQWTIAFGQY